MSDMDKKQSGPGLDEAVLDENTLEKISGGEGTHEIDGVEYTLTKTDVQSYPCAPIIPPWGPVKT